MTVIKNKNFTLKSLYSPENDSTELNILINFPRDTRYMFHNFFVVKNILRKVYLQCLTFHHHPRQMHKYFNFINLKCYLTPPPHHHPHPFSTRNKNTKYKLKITSSGIYLLTFSTLYKAKVH